MDEQYLHSVIHFARLYGIAETLHPLRHRENDEIAGLILEWAQAFARSGETDLLHFFESAIRSEQVE